MYTPTTFVRLIVVAREDYAGSMPFLTAVVTTRGDELVVAANPNGDPPTAFNVTEDGFRAQNGKYLFFDRTRKRVRLDAQPHNETQYINGTVYTSDVTERLSVSLCPTPDNIYALTFDWPCGNAFVELYPIPPQHLTALWENTTEYPSPRQRGWIAEDDNSTIPAAMLVVGATRSGGGRVEVGWPGWLGLFWLLF
ncbi:hypothetical protein CJU89_4609 [Yarrowia sp. B02]|nr:hypothetical protein CJU89_4609 [Yarrowia sp. B02]